MRVLLVRLDGIGDAAVCAPLIAALRDAGHEVGAAMSTRNAGLYAPGVLIAEHVLERIPWPEHGSTPETTARAHAEIAAQRYDVALVASEEPEAYELARHARTRVGFSTGWDRPLKSLWVLTRTTRRVRRPARASAQTGHEVETIFRLGQGLVNESTPTRDATRLCKLFVTPSTTDESRRRAGALLQAGPKWTVLGVPETVQREVAGAVRVFGGDVVCAPSDVAETERATGVEPVVFDSLHTWVRALDRATRVLTVDTGAAHVAGMLGVPVVDVFPDDDFEAQVRRWHPWASPYRAIRASALASGGVAALSEALSDGF